MSCWIFLYNNYRACNIGVIRHQSWLWYVYVFFLIGFLSLYFFSYSCLLCFFFYRVILDEYKLLNMLEMDEIVKFAAFFDCSDCRKNWHSRR